MKTVHNCPKCQQPFHLMTLIESAPDAIERCLPCDVFYSLITKLFYVRWTDGTYYVSIESEPEEFGTAPERALEKERLRLEEERKKAEAKRLKLAAIEDEVRRLEEELRKTEVKRLKLIASKP